MDDVTVDGRYVAQFYPHVVLAATLVMMGLPWVSVEAIGDTIGYAAFQVTGLAASVGCMVYLLGAFVTFKAKRWGAMTQAAGLLVFYQDGVAWGYMVAVVVLAIVLLLSFSPKTFDRLTRSIAGEK